MTFCTVSFSLSNTALGRMHKRRCRSRQTTLNTSTGVGSLE